MTVSAAFVPVTLKSASSTFATSSLKVTRQVRLLALVRICAGVPNSMEATRGAATGISALDRDSLPLSSSKKLTLTFRLLPASRVTG